MGRNQIFYTWCPWRLSLGYEFHGVHYRANHCIPALATAQEQGMASTTRSSHAFGNNLFLNGRYFFRENWEYGLVLTYKHWHAKQGCVTSSYFANNGYPPITAVSATGKWISYAVNLDIGYAF